VTAASTFRVLRRAGERRRTHGAAALEFALVLPALLLVILGIMDVGRLIWTQTTLDRAVEAAARCGAIDTSVCGTATKIQTYAADQAFGLTVANPSLVFAVSQQACGIRVAASFPFTLIIPWIATSDITLAATACYPT
jgi:Flp pilus assembly protein TadG